MMARFPKLYPEDVEEIEKILNPLSKNCSARATLFIDPEGRALAEGRSFRGVDRSEFSSETIASWEDVEKLVALFDQKSGRSQLLRMENVPVSVHPVGRGALLAIVFDQDTTWGLVNLYASQAVSKVKELLDEVEDRHQEGKRIVREFERKSDPPWPGTPLPA